MATADLHLSDRPGTPGGASVSKVRPGVSYSQAVSSRASSPRLTIAGEVQRVDEVSVPLPGPIMARVENVPVKSDVARHESTDDGLWTTVRH